MRRRLTGINLITALWLAAAPFAATTAWAAEPDPSTAQPTYLEEGGDGCIKCHDEFSDYAFVDIFETKHAARSDPDTPMARLQCETCHGPGSIHAELGSEEGKEEKARFYIRSFREGSHTPVEEQNRLCFSCHEGGHRAAWDGSRHQQADVACTSCHQIHTTHDDVRDPQTQPQVCFRCHKRQRAELFRASYHPMRRGQMGCSSCHEPHGSLTRGLLGRATLNQTCYECHPEKRGPFLWEHAPVSEDCTNCHVPHGSNHPALLKKRAPLLCQQCHSQAAHPSTAYTGDDVAGGAASPFLLGRSCLNCHSQVHGSNHPSGIKLQR